MSCKKNKQEQNVAADGSNYQNEVDEHFENLQAKFPNDKTPYLTDVQKLLVCFGQQEVPMLDKIHEQLENFCKKM